MNSSPFSPQQAIVIGYQKNPGNPSNEYPKIRTHQRYSTEIGKTGLG
jgi:hypothetical protein